MLVRSLSGRYLADVREAPDGACVTLYRTVTCFAPDHRRAGAVVTYEGRRLVSCEVRPVPFHVALDQAHDEIINR